MASTLDLALQRALAIRLNLQISLSSLAMVEEWMDIHLDRWLEHIPMPPEMPDGCGVNYSAMIGSDLRRIAWSAWGDPRGFVPRMADYFKLCNIAKSDIAILDQVGATLEYDWPIGGGGAAAELLCAPNEKICDAGNQAAIPSFHARSSGRICPLLICECKSCSL